MVYDYPGNTSFMQKLEFVQYNASLAISGCFRGTSRDKLYSELGLESLADRRFYRRLIAFYKIVNKKAPQYLIDYLLSQDLASINLRKRPAIYPLDARTERYRNSFCPYCISQWNNLDNRIRNLTSIANFKRAILDFVRPNPTPYFKTNRLSGFVVFTRLRVGFSHLREHKLETFFWILLIPFALVARMQLKIVNTTFRIALISLTNAPFCLMTFET